MINIRASFYRLTSDEMYSKLKHLNEDRYHTKSNESMISKLEHLKELLTQAGYLGRANINKKEK